MWIGGVDSPGDWGDETPQYFWTHPGGHERTQVARKILRHGRAIELSGASSLFRSQSDDDGWVRQIRRDAKNGIIGHREAGVIEVHPRRGDGRLLNRQPQLGGQFSGVW